MVFGKSTLHDNTRIGNSELQLLEISFLRCIPFYIGDAQCAWFLSSRNTRKFRGKNPYLFFASFLLVSCPVLNGKTTL